MTSIPFPPFDKRPIHTLLTMHKTALFLFLSLLSLAPPISAQKKAKRVRSTVKKEALPPLEERVRNDLKEYRFHSALQQIEKETDLPAASSALDTLYSVAEMGEQMMTAIDRVLFIDSMLVPKEKVLSAIPLSPSAGRLVPQDGSYTFLPPIADRRYASEKGSDGREMLSLRYILPRGESESLPLCAKDGTGVEGCCPWVLLDGITLYYATHSAGMGGLDLYVTRHSKDDHAWLKAENLGFPFTSPYDDFLYVVDEERQLGWFATTRCHPAGDSVCVYTFVPETQRRCYEPAAYEEPQLIRLARIHAISDTWPGRENEVKAARERLAQLRQDIRMMSTPQKESTAEPFLLNDNRLCRRAEDFRSDEARTLYAQWCRKKGEERELVSTLSTRRAAYAGMKGAQREAFGQDILKEEAALAALRRTLAEDARRLRATEGAQP